MQKRIVLAILIMLIGFSLNQAQPKSFEGFVQFKSVFEDDSDMKMNMDMDYYIKGYKIRTEIKSQEGKAVLLFKNDMSYMLMPDEKMYMELPKGEEEVSGEKEEVDELEKGRTGVKKEILGYMCEQYIMHEEDSDMEIWATSELGFFMFVEGPGQSSQISNKYFSKGFFPLLIKITDKQGSGKGVVEATKIEKRSLSDSMFEIPSGYTKMTMPSFDFKMPEGYDGQ